MSIVVQRDHIDSNQSTKPPLAVVKYWIKLLCARFTCYENLGACVTPATCWIFSDGISTVFASSFFSSWFSAYQQACCYNGFSYRKTFWYRVKIRRDVHRTPLIDRRSRSPGIVVVIRSVVPKKKSNHYLFANICRVFYGHTRYQFVSNKGRTKQSLRTFAQSCP